MFMKFYQPFEINIEVNKATGNMDKCTQQLFKGFEYSPKYRQNGQRH